MDEKLLGSLLKQAWLFEDPKAYEAGVRDAWDAVVALAGQGAGTGAA